MLVFGPAFFLVMKEYKILTIIILILIIFFGSIYCAKEIADLNKQNKQLTEDIHIQNKYINDLVLKLDKKDNEIKALRFSSNSDNWSDNILNWSLSDDN